VKLACFFCDGETYNPDGICGQCRKDGKSYPENPEDSDG
jgi:predicted amidophosphoribosyltransferase